MPKDEDDDAFEKLREFQEQVQGRKPFAEAKKIKVGLETHLSSMSERVVVIRLHESKKGFAPQATEEVLGIKKLVQKDDYSFEKGISLAGIENSFI